MNLKNTRERSPIFGQSGIVQPYSPIQSLNNNQPDNRQEVVPSSQIPQKILTQSQFSPQNIPMVRCHYHPDQQIRNFCLSPQCLMPLCPACVSIHQTEHEAAGTVGKFESLENCLTQAFTDVATECNKFVDDLSDVTQLMNEVKNQKQIHNNQIQESKQKLYQLIDSYFDVLERDQDHSQNVNTENLFKETTTNQQVQIKRWETLIKILEKLNSDKCLKTLIKYHSKEIQDQCLQYHVETQKFLQNQKSFLINLSFDPNVLQQINQSLQRLVRWTVAQDQGLQKQLPQQYQQKFLVQSPQEPLKQQNPNQQYQRPASATKANFQQIPPQLQQIPPQQFLYQQPQYNFAQTGQMIPNNFNQQTTGQVIPMIKTQLLPQNFSGVFPMQGAPFPLQGGFYPPQGMPYQPGGFYPPGTTLPPLGLQMPNSLKPSLFAQNPFLNPNFTQNSFNPASPSVNLDISFSPKINR